MIHRHAKHHHINLTVIYSLAVFSVIALSFVSKPLMKARMTVERRIEKVVYTRPLFNKTLFNTVTIRGKAYIVYDIVDNDIIASKNATTTLPLASITKVMTALTAVSHHSHNDKVIIRSQSIDGALDLGLRLNQSWNLSELLKYTLVFSSNDGAQSVADSFGGRDAFVGQMNTDAKNLGLTLRFTNPAGLDVGSLIGGEGTAFDVAKMLAVARKKLPDILDATTHTRISVNSGTGKITGVPNTNQYINKLSGAEMSKTGFTDSAGGNLAVVVDVTLGHPVAIVVLGSTREERFSDVALLYKKLLESRAK